MKLHHPHATLDTFSEESVPVSLGKTTHLGIGAHHDDLEFMAYHGILQCFQDPFKWFSGVTCTDGAGSSRTGVYAAVSDSQMKEIRREEQKTAARIGQYAAVFQLGYSSAEVKNPRREHLVKDLREILLATRPEVVYTHNPADKHDTHIGIVLAVIEALRSLPRDSRPHTVHGCECWRDLDWMMDSEKVLHDVGGRENLAAALNGVFDSQIAGGKRYDLGIAGRRKANATFLDPHAVDNSEGIALAMDLTPLLQDVSLDVADYVDGYVQRFRNDVRDRLQRLSAPKKG